MRFKKNIAATLRKYLKESSSEGDIMRDFLKYQFSNENEISEAIIINQNKAQYEIILFLLKLGFYKDTEYDIHYRKKTNFKVLPSDYVGSFRLVDFISEHKKYLAKKYNISIYNITDELWDDSINNTIKPNIERILSKYNLELSDTTPFLYGYGDLLITLKTPDIIKYSKKFPQIIMRNPNKIITTKEFFGIENRTKKRKFIRHFVGNIEYKFLLNPIKQDKYFFSGDENIFNQLFNGLLSDFLNLKNIEYESVILQIHEYYRNYNFVIGGDGFYRLEDVKEFIKNNDFKIKKINTDNRFYNILLDLKSLYDRLNSKDIKMIVFLNLGDNLTRIKNGGVFDKRLKKIFYPYIIKK